MLSHHEDNYVDWFIVKGCEVTLLFRQFLAFSVAGAIATTVHFLVLAIAVQLFSFGPVIGSIAGYITGAVVNYLLNYHVTFNSRNRHMETSIKFCVIVLSGLCLNTVIMFFLTQNLHYLLSQAIATATVLIWNFLCNRFWTFRESNLAKQS